MNETEALAWVADLFEMPVDEITLDTARDDVETWDSLGVLNLMAGLDEEFEILLEDEDLQAIKKVGDILEVLRSHGKIE